MKAPLLVPAPVLFPGRCTFCGRSSGAMVDTFIDDPGMGELYVCAETCVPVFAALIGLGDISEATEETAELRERVAVLEAELVEARPVLDAMAKAAARFHIDEPPEPKRSRGKLAEAA